MENLFGIMPFQNPHKTFLLITFFRSGFGFITFVILSSAIAFDARGQEIICSTGAMSLSLILVSVNSGSFAPVISANGLRGAPLVHLPGSLERQDAEI